MCPALRRTVQNLRHGFVSLASTAGGREYMHHIDTSATGTDTDLGGRRESRRAASRPRACSSSRPCFVVLADLTMRAHNRRSLADFAQKAAAPPLAEAFEVIATRTAYCPSWTWLWAGRSTLTGVVARARRPSTASCWTLDVAAARDGAAKGPDLACLRRRRAPDAARATARFQSSLAGVARAPRRRAFCRRRARPQQDARAGEAAARGAVVGGKPARGAARAAPITARAAASRRSTWRSSPSVEDLRWHVVVEEPPVAVAKPRAKAEPKAAPKATDFAEDCEAPDLAHQPVVSRRPCSRETLDGPRLRRDHGLASNGTPLSHAKQLMHGY